MRTKRIAPVIEKVRRWREKNGLSQRGAVEVMVRGGCEIKVTTLQKWEAGVNAPGRFTVKYLEDFLAAHPVIPDALRRMVSPKDPTPVKTVEAIIKARKAGETLKAIGKRYGLSVSGVSRIAKGNRRGGAVRSKSK